MLISMKWLKEYIDIAYTPEELDRILTTLGIEVEHISRQGDRYRNFVIGEVAKADKHPQADKLTLCEVDDGSSTRVVVCGAPNVAEGQKIVFAQPGAIVPNGGFEIGMRKIRGIESNGMICSKSELELSEDHSGIWVLPEDATIGLSLADYLGMNDVIFEISITPDRADCLSHIGIARDIAAFANKRVKMPETNLIESKIDINSEIAVEIASPQNCPRYCARIVRGVKLSESPDWLKSKLNNIGLRSINLAVDVTNFVLMECGQPLHAFDLDNIEGRRIVVRNSNDGERFVTLDSKERILDSEMLMICDANKPIAVGGVMGGENSEIGIKTSNILIESAYFAPDSIRKTSKKLGIQSDASYRFERGVDYENLIYALDRAAQLIAELGNGSIDSGLIDVYPNRIPIKEISLNYDKARRLIGSDITNKQMIDFLTRLEFNVVDESEFSLRVEVPTYRVDCSIEEDLIEEIARLFDYDNIQPIYSTTIDYSNPGVPKTLAIPRIINDIRAYLSANGFNEIITQNQTDPFSAKLFNNNAIEIANPLGEELSMMRTSLVPSILKVIERNIRLGNKNLSIYEIGKSFVNEQKADNLISQITENRELIIALSGNKLERQWGETERQFDFYDAKGFAEDLISYFRLPQINFLINYDSKSEYSPNSISINSGNILVGSLGELDSNIIKKFDVEQNVFIIKFDIDALMKILPSNAQYSKISQFPGINRDIAFLVNESIESDRIKSKIVASTNNLLKSCEVFDIYNGKGIQEGKKSIAFSLNFSANDRTLKEEEIEVEMNTIVKELSNAFSAELRK